MSAYVKLQAATESMAAAMTQMLLPVDKHLTPAWNRSQKLSNTFSGCKPHLLSKEKTIFLWGSKVGYIFASLVTGSTQAGDLVAEGVPSGSKPFILGVPPYMYLRKAKLIMNW